MVERLLAALFAGTAFLRPPALIAFSAALPEVRRSQALFVPDPLIGVGRRPGLTAAILALGLALAGLAGWILRRRGLPWPRAALWMLVSALGGPFGFMAALLLEPRRAWRPLPAEAPAEARPLLLKSA